MKWGILEWRRCGEWVEVDDEERVEEDESCNFHSAQLRLARSSVPIGLEASLLKTRAFRDFQMLHKSKTTLVICG